MYEVFAFFNVTEITQVLNAVAALMDTSDYWGLLRVFSMCALLVVVIGIFTNMAQWYGVPVFFILMALYLSVFVGKQNVMVIDRTGRQAPTLVANVPTALAWMTSSTSHIGEWLTRATETVFSLPNDLKFQQNGLMFGSKLVSESRNVNVMTPSFRYDLMLYIKNCVNPDILDGYKDPVAMRNSDNLWSTMGDTNPGRWSTYNGGANTAICPTVYSVLTGQWAAEATTQLSDLAKRINPQSSSGTASTLIQAQLADSYSTMLKMGSSAQAIIQQNMMINLYQDSEAGIAQMNNDPTAAQIALAKAQAQISMNAQYLTVGKIAEEALPKFRNVIELIIIALFPLSFLFVVLAGHKGWMLLKQYLFGLFWVQMWAPLYAILNFIATTSTAQQMKATSTLGMTLGSAEALNAVALQNHHIAGMLTMSIPVLAWALVKAGEMGGSAMLGSLASGAQSSGSAAAGQTSQGNIQAGNVRMDTSSFNTSSGNNLDQMMRLHRGGSEWTDSEGNKLRGVGGNTAIDVMANNPGSVGTQQMRAVTDTLSASANQKMEAASKQSQSAQNAQTAALSSQLANMKGRVTSQDLGSTVTAGDAAQHANTHNKLANFVETAGEKYGITKDQAIQIVSSASVGASLGKILSAKIGMDVKDAQAKQNAITADMKRDFGEGFADLKQYAKTVQSNEAFRVATTSNQATTAGTTAMFTKANSESKAAEAAMTNAVGAQQAAESAKTMSASINSDALKLPANSGVVAWANQELNRAAGTKDPQQMQQALDNVSQEFQRVGILPSGGKFMSSDEFKAKMAEREATSSQPAMEAKYQADAGNVSNAVGNARPPAAQHEANKKDMDSKVTPVGKSKTLKAAESDKNNTKALVQGEVSQGRDVAKREVENTGAAIKNHEVSPAKVVTGQMPVSKPVHGPTAESSKGTKK